MKQFVRVAVLSIAVLAAGRATEAQTVGLADDERVGLIGVGAYVGVEFDVQDNPVLVGADGRIKFGSANIEVNPRYTFRPFDDGSMQQADINLVTNYRLSNPGRFRPYSGLGLAIHSIYTEADESTTDVGLNLISGVRLAMRPGVAYEPFLQAQYTIMNEPANSFTLVLGTTFSFR